MESITNEFDKTKFEKKVQLTGVKFPASQSSKYLKEYKDHLLNMEKQPNIAKDYKEGDNKLLLLNPQYKKEEFSTWPEKLKSLITDNNYEQVDYELKFSYDDLNMQDVLRELLPKDVVIPTGFETVGTIAHLNLRSGQLPYKNLIGQVLLDKNQKITTVVNKTEKLSNVFRTPELEVIAGEDKLETDLKEGGCTFKLNFEKVYWNSKLQAERDRLLNYFNKGEVLCDMFCGIGPLSVRAAKKGLYVLANDLNPQCYEYLKINADINKIEKLIECFNMDAREFLKESLLRKENQMRFDHIYMNLPVDAVEFLDVFTGLFREAPKEIWNENNLPMIYVYGFDTGKTPEEVKSNFFERIQKAFGAKIEDKFDMDIHAIKDISSEKKMYCVAFRLPKEIAYKNSQVRTLEPSEDGNALEQIEKKIKS